MVAGKRAKAGGSARGRGSILVFSRDDGSSWDTISYLREPSVDAVNIAKEIVGVDHRISTVGEYVNALVFKPSLDGETAAAVAGALGKELGARGVDFVTVPRPSMDTPPLWSAPFILPR